jgi:formate hydrogenlyase subunit 3/multisubunit Na+/H+ antiporter MnhD subunit
MAVQSLLGWCVALLGAGAVASLVVSRRRELAGWIALAAVAAACLPLGAVVIEAFTGGVAEFELVSLDAVGARLAVAVDPLSALFLAITAVIALAAVLFSVRYMTHYSSD